MSPFVRRGDIKKIRLKQYVSLRSKRRHKIYILSLICFARMDLSEPHIEDIARDMRCDEMSIQMIVCLSMIVHLSLLNDSEFS